MKKYVLPLIFVMVALVGAVGAEYVKVSSERGVLLGQFEEAAAVVSAHPPESPEALAAIERGRLIALGWPCHWWEDPQVERSRAATLFENLIAGQRAGSHLAPPDEHSKR